MPTVWFRFYAELNERLPRERRFVRSPCTLRSGSSVAEALHALGVPPAEVDLVLVDGEPVGLERPLRDGDRVSVYPVFEAFDITALVRPHATPLRGAPRFAVDAPLGALAALLRRRGLDALHRPDLTGPALAAVAHAEHRVLLTRDPALLARPDLTHALRVTARRPRSQLAEVARRLHLETVALTLPESPTNRGSRPKVGPLPPPTGSAASGTGRPRARTAPVDGTAPDRAKRGPPHVGAGGEIEGTKSPG